MVLCLHLCRLAVQLGQLDLRRRHGKRHGVVELDVELVLEQLVAVPALAEPPGPLLVRLQPAQITSTGLSKRKSAKLRGSYVHCVILNT